MLHSAYKHFSCLNLVEVTSKNDSKPFKVAPVDGKSINYRIAVYNLQKFSDRSFI